MKILVYPKDINPYQELLYNNIKHKATIKYLIPIINYYIYGTFLIPFQLLYYRFLGYNIFHLHWTYNFKFPYNYILFRIIATIYFLLFIIFIKLLNYKLIWTVHNILPGENRFIFEAKIRNILSMLCDAKIAHSKNTIKDMVKLNININNIYVVPIGNYIGLYQNTITESMARKYFGFKNSDFVFLFFGRIDPYKGIENLLEAFEKISIKNKNVKLLIAGQCDNERLKGILNGYAKMHKDKIKIYIKFIDDIMIQYYFGCSNIVVYSFNRITTSSSVILALSLGKSIICPRIANLKELPKNVGIFYEPSQKDGLYCAMEYAIKNKNYIKKMDDNALNYAKSLSWASIADHTYEIYKKILI